MDVVVQRLKALRRARSLSQEALARELGVSVRTVARWERGESSPSPLARERIAVMAAGEEESSTVEEVVHAR